ncbi:hypothetical protein [Nostoc sp. CENA543]|nr:hypothetical protein [Nostoc sp. CENA543]
MLSEPFKGEVGEVIHYFYAVILKLVAIACGGIRKSSPPTHTDKH